MFQRLAKNKWVSRFRLNLFKHLEGCHARNLPLTSYELSRFLFSGPSFVVFDTYFFLLRCVFSFFHFLQYFFFLCSRDFPVNQFNPNFLPSISTKIARTCNEFQLPLYYSYFGITEFSRSNTGFLF